MTHHDRSSEAAREPLFAITLCSSTAPIPMPNVPESHLKGMALFKSRRVEDGRERFRLHLGYFSTLADAERVLVLVRRGYPSALIAPVPQASAGSLDSTAMTRFTVLQSPRSTVPPPPAPMAQRTQPAAKAVASIAPTHARIATIEPPATPGSVPGHQRYAVQLAFGPERIDLARLPELTIYEGYLLYAVETAQAGRTMYGVRLGFYDDLLSARLVAQYVRSEFSGVSIVPVSDGEVASAMNAKIRLTALRANHARTPAMPLWPRNTLLIAFEPGSQLALAT